MSHKYSVTKEKAENYSVYYIDVNEKDFYQIKGFIRNRRNVVFAQEGRKKLWAERLSELTGISIKEAKDIADLRIFFKARKVLEIKKRQEKSYSKDREKLLIKLLQYQPLCYIKDCNHAKKILAASKRHNESNYDVMLDFARQLANHGYISRSKVRKYARRNFTYYKNNDNVKKEKKENSLDLEL